MNKKEYLARLEALLASISQEERQAAMEYYTDYLEDAGPEGEAAAMEHLGSPEKVAAAILEGMHSDGSEGTWTEQGYEEKPPHRDVPDSWAKIQKRERGKKGLFWLIVVIAGMIFFGIPVFTTIASCAFALIIAAAVICFGGVAVVLALVIAGIALLIIGIIRIMAVPGTGAILAGSGFLCIAAAFLILPLALWFVRSVIPRVLRGVSWIFHRMFGRGGHSA